ncbi:hypothetical protein [Halocalculus aciditolerans]|uniref:DUF8009 domain-containing protein n=1 Tax=Halocalculus aciditolerans TaxID=1383812 RepID=A0A830FLG9_9EURY|nr:hypothetical protein [Halocalculus aciditolerans]GGL64339.1 hypothetical protein GCM10009039_22760 [Halocalculus aciditolerans]
MTGTQNTTETTDESDDSVTLVVNLETLLSAMRRNARDKDTRQNYRLRFSRPLEGRVTASLHVHQQDTYWPNPATDPFTLVPEQLIEDDPSVLTEYPEPRQVRKAAKEVDGVEALDDVSDETLNECWDVHIEVWEGAVRKALKPEVDIHERSHGPNVKPRILPVEYTSE